MTGIPPMLEHFSFILSMFLIPIFIGFSTCFIILKLIEKSSGNKFSFINIEAKKSPTNAKLLGGLALSCTLITTIIYLATSKLIPIDQKIINLSLVPIVLVTLYGFYDDKYEIRARQKLFFQILAVGILSFYNLHTQKDSSSLLYFSISMSVGLALVNGSNLIDGLDTSLIKIGTITACGFIYLGLIFSSQSTIVISLTTITSLLAFYFFNRAPAKIYAGEIGGGILGLIYFIQGQIIFAASQNIHAEVSPLSSLSLICIAAIYPLSELGITFSRRLYFKSAPFCGDHLHLHHNLKNYFNLPASEVSTILSFVNFGLILSGFVLSQFISPFIAIIACCSLFVSFYVLISYSFWNKKITQEQNDKLFLNLKDSPVYIINSHEIEHLYNSYTRKKHQENSRYYEAA